jgi:cell wall-associated NlpC family hydrolase
VRTPLRLKRPAPRTSLVLAVVTALVAGLAALGIPSVARAQTAVATIDTQAIVQATMAIDMELAAIASAEQEAAASIHIARQRAYAARKAAMVKVQRLRSRVVEVAKNQIGDRYSAGSSGPSAFDCSGLTRYVYKVATGRELPHQSYAQFTRVKRIPRSAAKPGDLVFFFRGGAHHVGVYIGNGRMVDAAGYGKGVRISPISGSWWSRTYSGMGRLLPA